DRNRIDEAIGQFVQALEMEPRDSASQFGLAVAYRRHGMLEEAGVELEKVQTLDGKFPGLALEKGRLAEARGDTDAAVASYREALEEAPNDAALKSRLGAVLVITGELEEGEKLLMEVIEAQRSAPLPPRCATRVRQRSLSDVRRVGSARIERDDDCATGARRRAQARPDARRCVLAACAHSYSCWHRSRRPR
ncbi:MAG: tetratricopeptide repeat protein, partial [Deltaproteobacteria bacterium]|nr:tetratricopeptide repeat protein [Deltaproteobacteria bacterium]